MRKVKCPKYKLRKGETDGTREKRRPHLRSSCAAAGAALGQQGAVRAAGGPAAAATAAAAAGAGELAGAPAGERPPSSCPWCPPPA